WFATDPFVRVHVDHLPCQGSSSEGSRHISHLHQAAVQSLVEVKSRRINIMDPREDVIRQVRFVSVAACAPLAEQSAVNRASCSCEWHGVNAIPAMEISPTIAFISIFTRNQWTRRSRVSSTRADRRQQRQCG